MPKSRKAACNKGPLYYTTIDGAVRVFRGRRVLSRIGRVTPCLARGLRRVISAYSTTIGMGKEKLVRKLRIAGPLNRIATGTLRRKLLVVKTKASIVQVVPPLIVNGRRMSRVTRVLGRTLTWDQYLVGVERWGDQSSSVLSRRGRM